MDVPIALTIAGSDSSAGAGIQADLKTFNALGVYGLSVITCVVAETPGKVSRIEPVSPGMVREQIEVLARNFPIRAIKTGLLCSSETIAEVAAVIAGSLPRIPLIVDPVITATGGDPLLKAGAVKAYEDNLFPLATLITPNLDEARQLGVAGKIPDRQAMERAGKMIEKKFNVPVLLKGGHLSGPDAIDLLFSNGEVSEFTAPFLADVATHGTGCTYSAAIAAGLAAGKSLPDSIGAAKRFVTDCIEHHFRWISRGGGNIDALNHQSWR